MNLLKYVIFVVICFVNLKSQEYYRPYYIFNDFSNFNINSNSDLEDIQNINLGHKFLMTYSHLNYEFNYLNNFYDKNNIYLRYSYNSNLNSQYFLSFSMFIENSKKRSKIQNIEYHNDSLLGYSTDLEKGYMSFQNENFFIKCGRDYFLPGYYSFNRILFSSKGYPFDQFFFEYNNNKISISSFYLHLDPFLNISNGSSTTQFPIKRYLNGHRIDYKFNNGYFAVNELIIYGGANSSLELPFLNPLIPYYIYHKNHGNFPSNSIISFEFFIKNKKHNFFFEFVLDDIQIDNDTSYDLEPAQFGFFVESKSYITKNNQIKFNYLMISNRTFNAPDNDYEKYINNNFPMGHFLGNNFWNTSFSIISELPNLVYSLEFSYLVLGEEALYSDFNKDYLDYTIEQGYSEEFPFGDKRNIIFLSFDTRYNLSKFFSLDFSISKWFIYNENKNGVNYLFSFNYNI